MSMRISVEQLNGETLVLEVTPEMRMREVKQQIKDMQTWEDELSRATTFVEMIFGNKKLGNDETVAEVGLCADSMVSALLRQNVVRCSDKDGFGPDIDPETLVIVEIPDSEIEVRPSAFALCRHVAKVIIPSSVRCICYSAFHRCCALRIVSIPDSATQIEDLAFKGCTLLTSVTIPDSVTQIGRYAFMDCASLTSVTIPDLVTRIGEGAFAGCRSLRHVTIPDSVTRTAEQAFEGCRQLTLRAPARLLCPAVGRDVGAMVAKECGCGECHYSWFKDGWVCPSNAGGSL